MLKNLGDGLYVDVGMALGVDNISDARGAAVADFDNDGDLDIVVNNNPGITEAIAPVLYRNDVGNRANWIEVELTGTTANRDAAGSEVRIELPGGKRLLRHIMIGSGYASQQSPRLQFGAGDAERIAKLTVDWKGPGGGQDVFEDVPANHIITIIQGQKGEPGTLTMAPGRPAAERSTVSAKSN